MWVYMGFPFYSSTFYTQIQNTPVKHVTMLVNRWSNLACRWQYYPVYEPGLSSAGVNLKCD